MGKLADALKRLKEQVEAPPPSPPAPPPRPAESFPLYYPDDRGILAPPVPVAPVAPTRGRVATAPQGAVQWIGRLYCPACGRHTAAPKDTDFGAVKRTRSKKHCTGCADPANCEACNPAPSQAGRNVSVTCVDASCQAKFTVTRETLKKGGVTYITL